MSTQFRRLTRAELNRETGGYTVSPPDGFRWVESARYAGWKVVDGARLSDGWRRLCRENWIASIPAKHGSNYYRAALQTFDQAGCTVGYIQNTTHAGGIQRLLYRLDPDVLAHYLPGWTVTLDGRHPVLAYAGEIVDQVRFRHLSFAAAIHRLAVESDEFDEIQRTDMVRRLGDVVKRFGDRFAADAGRLAIAHDLGCNRGISGAYNRIAKLRAWQDIDADELAAQIIDQNYLSAGRVRYTLAAAQEAP